MDKMKTQTGALNDNEETFNSNFTAIPKDIADAGRAGTDADLSANGMEYGEMNAADARESGYTDADGEAVDLTREDKEGSPTGAYTDIGAGRSSVVHRQAKVGPTDNRH